MPDFLDEKRREIAARLKELKPLVDEYARLEAADAALDGVVRSRRRAGAQPPSRDAPTRRRHRPLRVPAQPPRSRDAAAPRARAHGATRRLRSSRRSRGSPSPRSPSRWASSRTTSTACSPGSRATGWSRRTAAAGDRRPSPDRPVKGVGPPGETGPRPRGSCPAATQAAICKIVSIVARSKASTSPVTARSMLRSLRAIPRTVPSWWVNVLTACMTPNAVPRHGATRVS